MLCDQCLVFDLNLINAQVNVETVETVGTVETVETVGTCLLYTSPSPRDRTRSRMPSSA